MRNLHIEAYIHKSLVLESQPAKGKTLSKIRTEKLTPGLEKASITEIWFMAGYTSAFNGV